MLNKKEFMKLKKDVEKAHDEAKAAYEKVKKEKNYSAAFVTFEKAYEKYMSLSNKLKIEYEERIYA